MASNIEFLDDEVIEDFAQRYFNYTFAIMSKISKEEIRVFADHLLAARDRGSHIYFIGNGGSASTAGHFANDLAIGCRCWNNPFLAVSLCENQSISTAIGNDYSFDDLFAMQLSICLKKGDILVAISASGNSLNLLRALEVAKKREAISIGLTAFDGGKLKVDADYTVHVPTNVGDYGPAEDAHLMLNHVVVTYLKNKVGGDTYIAN